MELLYSFRILHSIFTWEWRVHPLTILEPELESAVCVSGEALVFNARGCLAYLFSPPIPAPAAAFHPIKNLLSYPFNQWQKLFQTATCERTTSRNSFADSKISVDVESCTEPRDLRECCVLCFLFSFYFLVSFCLFSCVLYWNFTIGCFSMEYYDRWVQLLKVLFVLYFVLFSLSVYTICRRTDVLASVSLFIEVVVGTAAYNPENIS